MAKLKRNRMGRFIKLAKVARKARKARRNPSRKASRPLRKGIVKSGPQKGKQIMVVGKRLRPSVYRTIGGHLAVSRGRASSKLVGMRLNPKRRRRGLRRNPSSAVGMVKAAFSKPMLIAAASTAAGYLAGRYINAKVVVWASGNATAAPYAKYAGVVSVLVGGIVAAKTSKPAVRAAAIGIAASGIESVLRQLMPATFAKLGAEEMQSNVFMGESVNMGESVTFGDDTLTMMGRDGDDY